MNDFGYNKDGSPRKKGSGRPRGYTSFTSITLTELNNLFGDPSVVIPVSRVWLDKKRVKSTIDLCNQLNALDK